MRWRAVRVVSRRTDMPGDEALSQASIIAIGIFSAAVAVVIVGVLIAVLLYKRRRYQEAYSDEYDSGDTSSNPGRAFFTSAPASCRVPSVFAAIFFLVGTASRRGFCAFLSLAARSLVL